MSDSDEPLSFQEAWWDPDLISRDEWREASRLEFKNMLWQKVSAKFQVWNLQTNIPQWLMMSHSELWWQE